MALANLFRKKSVHATHSDNSHGTGLNRVLTVRDLTFFGIAAIIGAGSFSSIGSACFSGGPAVIFLFIICAIACGFTAMCYAEFATRVPASGSAYTYAYVSFGELSAWIIGWALLMEYSIGNIYVAFSWSGYFVNLIEALGIHFPTWLTNNYSDSHQAFIDGVAGKLSDTWASAPNVLGLRIIFDLPAVMINILVTWLVYVGTKESRNASNIMVMVKLAIILLVIIIGGMYVDINNWTPFMPNQFSGVMAGVSGVFFAYIGFDAVSTLAEESKNPQRDLPRGMIYSLIICTIIFIILALVLTGMVSYTALNVSDPLAEVFALKGIKWMLFIVSIAAVVAMTSVILVFQMGQPRIWMAMSRDGLLPQKFSEIHPKYQTPAFSTLITGLVVGIPIFFVTPKFVLDFTSIGTLFAFVLVCGGILILPKNTAAKEKGKFKMPYINAKYIVPIITIIGFIFIYEFDTVPKKTEKQNIINQQKSLELLLSKNKKTAITIDTLNISQSNNNEIRGLIKINQSQLKYIQLHLLAGGNYKNPENSDAQKIISRVDSVEILTSKMLTEYKLGTPSYMKKNFFIRYYEKQMVQLELINTATIKYISYLDSNNYPMIVFYLVWIAIATLSFIKNYSLIPVLGLLSCCYLLTGMGWTNWMMFSVWLVIGLVVYFMYGYKKSKLNTI